jgi:hypothetical protein
MAGGCESGTGGNEAQRGVIQILAGRAAGGVLHDGKSAAGSIVHPLGGRAVDE